MWQTQAIEKPKSDTDSFLICAQLRLARDLNQVQILLKDVANPD